MTAEQIANEVVAEEMNLVVVTGGEPTVYNLGDLTTTLYRKDKDIKVHLETSGGFPITGLFDWVTLSPKKWKPPLEESIMLADEFKIIVEDPDDIHFYLGMLFEKGLPVTAKNPIWLHPEWSHRNDPEVLGAIIAAVKAGDGALRAGWQLHKLYKVDALDQRSRVPVPLGGNPEKGI